MIRIILYAALLEIIYLLLSFVIAQVFGQWSYEGEAIRTGLRAISIVFYGYYYQKYFYDEHQTLNARQILTPSFVAAVSLLFFFAIVYTNAEQEKALWQTVFALSGMVAGLREELFYRGMIQNTLQKKFDRKIALLATTSIFVLSHIQYFYYGQFQGLLFITLAGLIFGSIYMMTNSVVVTAIIHGVYDALLSFNIAPFRISNTVALPLLLLITVGFIVINKKLFRSQRSGNIEITPI